MEATREIALHLPYSVIARLEQAATQRHVSMESIVSELASRLSPSFEPTGDAEYDALIQNLWLADIREVQAGTKQDMEPQDKTRLSELLAINRERQATPDECAEMNLLQSKGNLVALVRAAAFRVLKARQAEADDLP